VGGRGGGAGAAAAPGEVAGAAAGGVAAAAAAVAEGAGGGDLCGGACLGIAEVWFVVRGRCLHDPPLFTLHSKRRPRYTTMRNHQSHAAAPHLCGKVGLHLAQQRHQHCGVGGLLAHHKPVLLQVAGRGALGWILLGRVGDHMGWVITVRLRGCGVAGAGAGGAGKLLVTATNYD